MSSSFGRRPITVRHGAYLPHWTAADATYSICFRLADSPPSHVLTAWQREREALLAEAVPNGTERPAAVRARLDELFSAKVESHLDAGHGACWLQRSDVAQCMADALRHFAGERFVLHAWCIMPNHVHVIVQPLAPSTLPDILKTWKGFSAKTANRLLQRTGAFWQEEYYDHLIRDERDLARSIRYVLENPARARLTNWRWVWSSESAQTLVARVS